MFPPELFYPLITVEAVMARYQEEKQLWKDTGREEVMARYMEKVTHSKIPGGGAVMACYQEERQL